MDVLQSELQQLFGTSWKHQTGGVVDSIPASVGTNSASADDTSHSGFRSTSAGRIDTSSKRVITFGCVELHEHEMTEEIAAKYDDVAWRPASEETTHSHMSNMRFDCGRGLCCLDAGSASPEGRWRTRHPLWM